MKGLGEASLCCLSLASAFVEIIGSSSIRSGLAHVCNHLIYGSEYTSNLLSQISCCSPQPAFRIMKLSTDLPPHSNGDSRISEMASFRLGHSLQCYTDLISIPFVFPHQVCAPSCLTLLSSHANPESRRSIY